MGQGIENRHSADAIERLRKRQFRTGVVVRVKGRVELHQHNRAGTKTRIHKIEL